MQEKLIESFDPEEAVDNIVEEILNCSGKKVVAFSGGVDSTLTAYLCKTVDPESIAVTIDGETIPRREIKNAVEVARKLDLNHRIISLNQLKIPGFIQNPPDRCYYCKKAIIYRIMLEFPDHSIFDGTNKDDLVDFRPGLKAAKDLGVISVLRNYTKNEIREIAKHLNLPNWNKPSASCLATRIPFNQPITMDMLRTIEKAEDSVIELGFRVLRVRVSGKDARIEVGKDELERAFELKGELVSRLRKFGFSRISLDLEGYKG